MSLRDKSRQAKAGDTIIRSEDRITSALGGIDGVKQAMVDLKQEVDASVAAADGVFSATDQAEVNATLQALKAQVVGHAAGL